MVRKIKTIIIFLLLLTVTLSAQDIPKLKSRIMDLHGLLTPREEYNLETELKKFEHQTSNQLAVLIISSLQGYALEDYAIKVVDQWQLGDKKKENGVLLLIAMQDRKIRIEVGYGLEGALTDLISGTIIRNDLAPAFRSGHYYDGVSKALNSIMLATQNEYTAPPQKRRSSQKGEGSSIGSLIFFILFMIFGMLGGRRRGRGSGLFWLLLGSNMFRSGGHSSGFGGGSGFGGFSGGGGGFGGGGASGGW